MGNELLSPFSKKWNDCTASGRASIHTSVCLASKPVFFSLRPVTKSFHSAFPELVLSGGCVSACVCRASLGREEDSLHAELLEPRLLPTLLLPLIQKF